MKASFLPSKYNTIIQNMDKWCVFNSLYGTIGIIANPKIADMVMYGGEYEENQLTERLCNDGLIHLQTIDQESICQLKRMDLMYQSQLHLNLMPTFECNFRCTYCYENFPDCENNFPDTNMSMDLQRNIVKYVKKNIKSYSGLIIEWYGGEPLLKKNTIFKLGKEVADICKTMYKPYFSTITTNGYLLDIETFRELLACKILKFHITLDGFEHIHDRHRILESGEGTYKVILKNLKDIRDNIRTSNFSIVIRVNVTNTLLPELHTWIHYLYEEFGKDKRFKFFFRAVEDRGGNSIQGMREDILVDQKVMYEQMTKANVPIDYSFYYYGTLLNATCIASKRNAYIIDPYGNIRKCGEYLRDDRTIVGQVESEGFILKKDKFAQWFTNRVTEREKCKTCKLISACYNSSCPMRAEFLNKDCYCSFEHRNIDHILELFMKYDKYDFIHVYDEEI